ncbi:MAG TPA: hypothetical protein VMS77_08465 [Conexivisphaerales archaeon]|nr:hypothetical protein [Conexivisphaerales archaeon]
MSPVTDNCPDCASAGVTTECQYMEFPTGVHHYFSQKTCTFHYWTNYVRPRTSWKEFLDFAKAESAAAGYHLTLPPDAIVLGAESVVNDIATDGTTTPQPEALKSQSPADAQPAEKREPTQPAPPA